MSWLKRKLTEITFQREKVKSLEKLLTDVVQLSKLKDEHLLYKDTQLAIKEREFMSILVANHAALVAVILAQNGEVVLDKIFIDCVNSPDWTKSLHTETLPDGSLKLSLQEEGAAPNSDSASLATAPSVGSEDEVPFPADTTNVSILDK